jgi:tetratricopeptide (TPR) repeat protein/DNA-binding CsgD family transcriptional regulator
MKSFLFISFLLCFCTTFSQNYTKKDTVLINKNIKKYKDLFATNIDSAYFYIKVSLEISQQINYTEGIALSNYYLGKYFFKKQLYKECESFFKNSLENYKILNDEKNISLLQNQLGWLFVIISKYDLAIENANYSLQNEKLDSYQKAFAYNTLASSFNYLGNYPKAIEFYLKGLKIFEETENKRGVAVTYNNIAIVYMQIDNRKALNYFIKTNDLFIEMNDTVSIGNILNNIGAIYLELSMLDSAKFFLHLASENHKNNKNDIEYARTVSNLANLYIKLDDLSKAEYYLDIALKLFSEFESDRDLAICFTLKADIYFSYNDINMSINALKTALVYANQSNSIQQILDVYKDLSKNYFQNKNFELAFNYLEKYSALRDSTLTSEKAKLVENLNISYETEKKEKEIENLKKEQKISKYKTYILISIIFFIFLTFTIVIYIVTSRMRINKQKMQLLLEEQKVNKLEVEKKQLIILNTNIENDKLKLEIDLKNKELTTATMNIIQFNQFYEEVEKNLIEVRNYYKKTYSSFDISKINQVIYQFSSKQKNEMWEEFELRFLHVHNDFYLKLSQQFPDLSPNEKRLCAFLKLNMSTKEISRITFQSVNSLRVARTRLRKKLNISTDENLTNFLMNF